MIKKVTAALTAMAILTSSVAALAAEATDETSVSIQQMEKTEVETIELSLEGAIGMALENNPRIQAADSAINSATLSLEVTTEKQKTYDKNSKYIIVSVPDGIEMAYLKHGYYPFAAQKGLDLAVISKEQVIAAISYEVTEKYYNVKLLESLLGIANSSLQMAKDNEKIMKDNFAVGYVSALEVRNAENAVTQAEYSVQSYERNLKTAIKSLKLSLQIENTNCNLVLTDEIVLPVLPENVDEMIAGALITRYDVNALKTDYDLKTRIFDITKLYVNEKTALYHSAQSDYINSKATYENTTKALVLALNNEYSGILTLKDNITVAENNLSVASDAYDAAKAKFDMGLMTNLELTNYMVQLEQRQVELENAKVTYLLAVEKFGYNTTIGL